MTETSSGVNESSCSIFKVPSPMGASAMPLNARVYAELAVFIQPLFWFVEMLFSLSDKHLCKIEEFVTFSGCSAQIMMHQQPLQQRCSSPN